MLAAARLSSQRGRAAAFGAIAMPLAMSKRCLCTPIHTLGESDDLFTTFHTTQSSE